MASVRVAYTSTSVRFSTGKGKKCDLRKDKIDRRVEQSRPPLVPARRMPGRCARLRARPCPHRARCLAGGEPVNKQGSFGA